MTWVIFGVLFYNVVLIFGIGGYLAFKAKQTAEEGGTSFLLSNRDLPVPVVATTLALTVLGAAHVLGGYEMTWFNGAVTAWFSLAHVILLTVVCLTTGRWVRRLGVSTIPELLELLHGRNLRVTVSCVMAGVIFGILTLETQGLGILFATLTGWSIVNGAIAGGILGIFYVILAGMKEIGWVNLINTIVMYVGVVLATVWIGLELPAGSWEKVTSFYTSQDQGWMLSIFGTPQLLLTFALGNVIAVTFCQGISQMLMQPCMAAKDEAVVRKSLWIAAPVNGMFGIFVVVLGLMAKTMPEFAAAGPKLYGTTMLATMLPGWLVAWVLASFLGAVLSTFAMCSMAPATIFALDIYKTYYNPQADDAEIAKVTRMAIVVLAIIAMAVASFLPPILAAINWLFSFIVPVFWLVIMGLFWKRSDKAAVATCILAWVANFLWSFTGLPGALNMASVPNAYVTLAVTFVFGGAFLAFMDGQPGYFRSAAYADRMRALSFK